MSGIKIQINSLKALERLIGGDSELELDIRKNIVIDFTKRYLKELVTTEEIQKIDVKFHREVQLIAEEKLREQGVSWNNYLQKWTFSDNFKKNIKESINIIIKDFIKKLLKEEVDKFFKDNQNIVELIQETFKEKVEKIANKETIRVYEAVANHLHRAMIETKKGNIIA